jgi:23S rRNA pseudouridine1911/1915/1917 synthase
MPANEGYDYRERAGADARDEPLLDYLIRRFSHSTESEWRSRIEAGDVRVEDAPATAGQLLSPGQRVSWKRAGWVEPEAPLTFGILDEDGDLLAVEKPAGLPTLPGAGFLQATLLHLVTRHAPDAAPLHRLGRWTSGVVLFAKSQLARADLSRQWRAREVGKRYRGLASGDPAWDAITIARPIGPVPHETLGTVHAARPSGMPSTSHVTVLERRENAFVCDVRIETGRPHQIRIHLAAAGHPLVGDPLFAAGGLPIPGTKALPGDPGYTLHAEELSFRHPRTGRPVTVTSPAPDALR